MPEPELRRVIRRGTLPLKCIRCARVSSNYSAFEVLFENTEGCFYTPITCYRVCFHECGHHQHSWDDAVRLRASNP